MANLRANGWSAPDELHAETKIECRQRMCIDLFQAVRDFRVGHLRPPCSRQKKTLESRFSNGETFHRDGMTGFNASLALFNYFQTAIRDNLHRTGMCFHKQIERSGAQVAATGPFGSEEVSEADQLR